jgi:hypothetical protein
MVTPLFYKSIHQHAKPSGAGAAKRLTNQCSRGRWSRTTGMAAADASASRSFGRTSPRFGFRVLS